MCSSRATENQMKNLNGTVAAGVWVSEWSSSDLHRQQDELPENEKTGKTRAATKEECHLAGKRWGTDALAWGKRLNLVLIETVGIQHSNGFLFLSKSSFFLFKSFFSQWTSSMSIHSNGFFYPHWENHRTTLRILQKTPECRPISAALDGHRA